MSDAAVDWIGALASDAELLGHAARVAGLEAAVPACPGWSVADILLHIGSVLYRASLVVGEQRGGAPHRSETTPPPAADPFEWFNQGRTSILPVLRDAVPGASYWTFRGPRPLRWWLRRLASETAVHRVDAQQAAGLVAAVDPDLAVDGIDEKLETYLPVIGPGQSPDRPVTVALRVEGGRASWTVTIGGGGVSVAAGEGPRDALVRARAPELYLWLWGRAPLEAVTVEGDRVAALALRSAATV